MSAAQPSSLTKCPQSWRRLVFAAAVAAGGGGGGQRREGRWHWATTTVARPSELASPISPSEHVVRGLVLHSALNRLLPACACRGR